MKKTALLFIVLILTGFAHAQSNNVNLLTAEGKSSLKLIPEELSFTVNLNVKDPDYTKCAELALEKADNIKKLFVKNGIDKDLIKANSYSIREIHRYDQQTRQTVPDGYEASIPFTVRTKRDYKKNDKIFELIKDNLDANFNLNFSLSDEQMEAVKEKLIVLAVKDAKQKAEWIASASSVSLKEIKNIQYGEPSMIVGYRKTQDLMLADAMPMTREANAKITDVLSPDEVEMRTSIIISWVISGN